MANLEPEQPRTVIARIRDRLKDYPHVSYTSTECHLAIPAQTPTGFCVWIDERKDGWTIGFEGWHEEFTDQAEALNAFAFGLSTLCRLKVFRRGRTDYKWQLLHQEGHEWVVDSEVGLFWFPFWRRCVERELQNDIVNAV